MSRRPVRWPLLARQGEVVSVDFFGPLPTTERGHQHILLFTDRFSRRAAMFATTAAEFTAVGVARICRPLHPYMGMSDETAF